jgi:PDZ domain
MRCLLSLSLLPVLWLVAAVCPADPPPAAAEPERTAPEIAEWIRHLGDESFAVREAATKKLMEREDAAPALRQALKSPDHEVARRADDILREQARRKEERAQVRLAELAKNGQVDEAAELLVRRPSWGDEDAAWQVMTALADRLIDLGEKEFGEPSIPPRQNYLPVGDYRRYLGKARPKSLTTGRVVPDIVREEFRFVVRAEEIEVVGNDIRDSLLVSAGAVRAHGGRGAVAGSEVWRSVIFAGGPVEFQKAFDSIIICDGDFTVASEAMRCLIVARGDVRCGNNALKSRIITSGKVHFPKSSAIKEDEPNPLGFVQFFDPASVGVTVEAAEGGVRIKEAADGKPFAKAGLQAGDLAIAADGTPLDSPEAFRRLLRKKLATGGDFTLEVRREGKSVGVVVPFKE